MGRVAGHARADAAGAAVLARWRARGSAAVHAALGTSAPNGACDGDEDLGHGERRGQLQGDASDALSDQSGDLEQEQAESVELPPAEGGRAPHDDAPKRIEQSVGDRMQKQSEGVGDVGGARQPIASERSLEVLDRVFRLSARSVQLFVDDARLALVHGGDDEARVGLVAQMLSLHHDAPLVRPASRGILEGVEPTRGLARGVWPLARHLASARARGRPNDSFAAGR